MTGVFVRRHRDSQKGHRDTRAQQKVPVRTQREGGQEPSLADTLILDFPPQEQEKSQFCGVSLPSAVLCYGSPSKLV